MPNMGALASHPAEYEHSNSPHPSPTCFPRKPPTASGDVGLPSFPSAPRSKRYRLRFFNFNMANSAGFGSLAQVQGPGGRGNFAETLRAPMPDGSRVDLVFATFVETRLIVGDWVQDFLERNRDCPVDTLLQQNARREGAQNTRSMVRTLMEGIAASYNGNLKSLLAFSSSAFVEDPSAVLFGRLTEATIAGVPVPNPKKAFMGRTVVETGGEGLRFCFIGAHFPIAKLAAALEDRSGYPLHGAKVALAQTLRKVLRKACKKRVVDDQTVLFVQGDINSRTVFCTHEAKDVLLELLKDDALQAAIQHELPLPPGRWCEIVAHSGASDLPVTYKYSARPIFAERPNHRSPPTGQLQQLTIGHVINSAGSPPRPQRARSSPAGAFGGNGSSLSSNYVRRQSTSCTLNTCDSLNPHSAVDTYRRILTSVGDESLAKWGVVFKKTDFRPFRFPACADRVIYWAPDHIADRMTWEMARGGYEVNHSQFGSDHRPVSLEVILQMEPPQLPAHQVALRAPTDSSNSLVRSYFKLAQGPDGDELSDDD